LPKKDNINVSFVKYKIEPLLRSIAKGRKGEKGEDEFTKVYPSMLEDIEINMPVDKDGKFDVAAQAEIAGKYELIAEVKAKAAEYQKQIKELHVDFPDDGTKVMFSVNDLFKIKSGNSSLTQKYGHLHQGPYVVYSANTKQNGVFGYIDTFEYDTECIQLTTNGVYAGTFFYREKHRFNINGDARLLIRKSVNLDYHYLINGLRREFVLYRFNWENKPSIAKIKLIKIPVPVTPSGAFDLAAQREIAERYRKIEQVKNAVMKELEKIKDTVVELE